MSIIEDKKTKSPLTKAEIKKFQKLEEKAAARKILNEYEPVKYDKRGYPDKATPGRFMLTQSDLASSFGCLVNCRR